MSLYLLVLAIATVFCWGVGAIFDKLALGRLDPQSVFFARLYLMFIVFLTPMVMAWEPTRVALFRSDKKVIAYLFGSVVFTTGGMYIYYQALAMGNASKIVPFCAAYPVIAFLLALAILKEPLSYSALAGTLLVASGAYLLSRS